MPLCVCVCVLSLSSGSVWRESARFDSLLLGDASVVAGLYVLWAESVFLEGSESGKGVKKNLQKIQNKTCTWKKERQKKVGLLLFLNVNIERYIHIINIYIYIIYIQCILHQLWDVSFFFFDVYFCRDLGRSNASLSSFAFFSLFCVRLYNYECFLESFVFCICCNSLQPGVPCLSHFSACDNHTGVSNELSRAAEEKASGVGHEGEDCTWYATVGCRRLYIFVYRRTCLWPRASSQTWPPNRSGENDARVSRNDSWWRPLLWHWTWTDCSERTFSAAEGSR